MKQITIRPAVATDADWIVAQHSDLYARDDGFDDTFAVLVADIVAEFFDQHDGEKERGWIAEMDGQRVGCIFCVRVTETTAKLRLFLLSPQARGQGLGQQLLATCTDFARDTGYTDMVLWTHASHTAACALYARSGWTLQSEKNVRSFGCDLIEQSWTRPL
ncbi:GNAT family N-acetyltransferase [Octadecabacter sp. G9-8]|uniref:GNAT family N-acetyltransferase n=1 Tax=Octadecabacter dasysiphoniae TaxID=2909341 RepID=A0ABS9CS22_9RHOB|nr:GNAT family N-acetyltransferase [Octadecabacter dasysiphoniae]MCF2870036.1 GNAT family N-acetyltransferase [Octadecabacter dasysiphoniae]